MRAVVVREFGPPSVLVANEVPDPVPAAGQALIEVEIANVTFVETQVRAGRPPHLSMLPPLPAILGNGVGGAIGHAAFELLRPGGRFCPFGMASGAFAPVFEADAEARNVALIRGGRPTPEALRALVQAALAEAVAGRLHPLIGQRFPLERAADAHVAMQQRTTVGKTLLLSSAS